MKYFISLLFSLTVFTTHLQADTKKNELLLYCAITMIPAMEEMSKEFEKLYPNITIKMIKSSSGDLYNSLKLSKKGDLYLPSYHKFIDEHTKENLFLTQAMIGFNQGAIFVKKGNPKHIKNLDDLLNQNLGITLCNPSSGSIGEMTKEILVNYKKNSFFTQVYDNVAVLGIDSRNLSEILSKEDIDMTLNWRATYRENNNDKKFDMIEIESKYAPKQQIILTTLAFSKNKKMSESFLHFATSSHGKAIMKKHGFL